MWGDHRHDSSNGACVGVTSMSVVMVRVWGWGEMSVDSVRLWHFVFSVSWKC